MLNWKEALDLPDELREGVEWLRPQDTILFSLAISFKKIAETLDKNLKGLKLANNYPVNITIPNTNNQ